MLKLNTLKFFYKYLHNELRPYFYSFNIRVQGARHTYDTRNSGQLRVEMTRTEYADTSRITWTVSPLPLMVVLMTVAPCLNKDPHINGYKKETWVKFDKCSIPMPVYLSMLKSCNFDDEQMYLNLES